MQKDNDKMNFEDKVNNAKYILDSTKEWINNVDIKISILIAFMGVVLGYILIDSNTDIMQKIINSIETRDITCIKILKGICVICLYGSTIFSIIKLTYALKGKINIKDFKESGVTLNSLIFYGSISNKNYEDFKNNMINQTKESNFNDLLSQIYINSKICNSKFKNYNNGLNYAILSILLLFLTKFFGII